MIKLKIEKTSSVVATWKSTINLIFSKPKVLLPFLILAICEWLALYILSCAPHFPVSKILAPPIKSIWGPIYLHYPFIYDLLPKMFYWAKVAIGIFLGSLTAGMAVSMISQLSTKKQARLKTAFITALKHYVSLFLLALLFFAGIHFLVKYPPIFVLRYFRAGHAKLLFLGPKFWLETLVPVFKFITLIVFQSLFVYAFPFIILKKKKFLAALFLGVRLFFSMFIKTFVIILVPMVFYVPVTILNSNTAFLLNKFAPEVIIPVLFVGVFVGVMVVDSLVTIATTLLFMEATGEK